MTQTINIDAPRPLTEEEQRKVQAYAESLVVKPTKLDAGKPLSEENIEAISKIMARLGTDKSGVELAHEANDIRAEKYEKYFK